LGNLNDIQEGEMLPSLVWMALFACKGSAEDTDTVPTGGGGDDGCGETPPTIETFEIRNEGMSTGDQCGSDSYPRIRLAVDGYDEDGDLTYWTIRAWWDTTVDGSVDTSAGGYEEVFGTLDGDECAVHDANLGMIICITGNQFEYETEYEFGVLLLDNLDNESDNGVAQVASFTTPAADGTYE
jgi:hypothetical protein